MKNLMVLNPIAFAIRHGEKRVFSAPSRIGKTFKYKRLAAMSAAWLLSGSAESPGTLER